MEPKSKLKTHHLALKVNDVKRAETFYSDILKLPIDSRHNYEDGSLRSAWLKNGDSILMLEHTKDPATQSEHGWHLLAFEIKAVDRAFWKKYLEDNGVKITKESDYSLYFSDPEGNKLALSHYPEKFA